MMVLQETITLFKSGGEKDIDGRLERACLNDLDKLFDRMNLEINALPDKKRKIIIDVINDYIENMHVEIGNDNKCFRNNKPK